MPKLPADGSVGPIQLSICVSKRPTTETYAPHLHIKAFHENVKTIAVGFRPDEIVEMRVPIGFNNGDMLNFVADGGEEIYKSLQDTLDSDYETVPDLPNYNSRIPFLGEYVPIISLKDDKEPEGFRDGAVYLQPELSGNEIREAVLCLFGNMAYDILKPRVDHFSELMKMQYNGLKIDDGRRTWGSFNADTQIIFLTRRLLMMSADCIDSLIVHELAHTKAFAHDASFFDEIHKIMPDYDAVDSAFGDAAIRLFEEGWI